MSADPLAKVTRVRMAPLRHQAKVLLAFVKGWSMVCLVGGLGSAKTVTQILVSLYRAQTTPGGRQLLLFPTSGMIEDIAKPAFDEWLERLRVRYFWKRPQGRLNLYLLVAGRWAELRFRSGEKPDRLDGGEYCHVSADESGQLTDKAVKKLFARGRGYARITKLMTGTPEGMAGPFYREAEKRVQPGTLVVRARTMDNPHLKPSPEAYLAELAKGYSPQELKGYSEGFFVPPSGRVYWAFDAARHVLPFDWRIVGDRVMGCDFNVSPMFWCHGVRWHVNDSNGGKKWFIWIWSETQRENTNTWAHAELCADVWADFDEARGRQRPSRSEAAAQVTAYPDAAGRARSTKASENDFGAMQRVGFKVRAPDANPPVKDRVFALNTAFHEGRCFIDPCCEQLIRCLQAQARDKYGEPDKTQGVDHAPDALGYLWWGTDPMVAPKGNARDFSWM